METCSQKKIQKSLYQGKASTISEEKFRAADIKIPLFINNVDINTKQEDIIDYVMTKNTGQCEQKLYNAYIVNVPNSKLFLFLNDNLWPEGVTFRRFVRNLKKNINGT